MPPLAPDQYTQASNKTVRTNRSSYLQPEYVFGEYAII